MNYYQIVTRSTACGEADWTTIARQGPRTGQTRLHHQVRLTAWIWTARCWLCLVCLAAASPSPLPAEQLRVYPSQLTLSSKSDRHTIVVQRINDDTTTCDVTNQVDFQVSDPPIVQVDAATLSPVADGDTTLEVTFEGQAATIAVHVNHADEDVAVGFQRDVVPIFSRHGCNAGTCHGSSRGQDGFRLSLFGFDPHGDYHRITREMATRRVNLAVPWESLLLEKATGSVPHTGGKRLEPDGRHYQLVRRWLEEGAHLDDDAVSVASLQILPPEITWRGGTQQQNLLVIAEYADGSHRDVTDLAVVMSNNESVAQVNGSAAITVGDRGEAFVTARFEKQTVGIPVIVLPETDNYVPVEESGNYIDDLVMAKLQKLRLNPGPICSDAEFIRRATVDANGLLPTVDELNSFIASEASDKRAQLVASLLAKPEFRDVWSAKWADLLMIREKPNLVSRKAAVLFNEWLQTHFGEQSRLDVMARDLITARGTTFDQPASIFYVAEGNRLKVTENIAQLFLGIRLQCAQCHNHPFDRWTMDDYYGFASFFAGVYRKPNEDYRRWSVWAGGTDAKHPVTGAAVSAKFLGGEQPKFEQADRREKLADWLTSPENPYFARSMANRVWAHFFGRGIVDPVDDVRVSNPPVNAALYDSLAEKLVAYDYQLPQLAADIMLSNAYQRSIAKAGETADLRNFTHASVRRIPATNLLDCISQVTESPEKFRGLPPGSRAVHAINHVPENYFLRTFGRTQRTSACACETRSEPTLSQALHLLNGNTIHGKIERGGTVKRLLDAGQSPADVVEELYLRCLSRHPTDDELSKLLRELEGAPSPQEGLNDVFWALLNSREFLFVH